MRAGAIFYLYLFDKVDHTEKTEMAPRVSCIARLDFS